MNLEQYRNQIDPQPAAGVKVSHKDTGVNFFYLNQDEIFIQIEINGKIYEYRATPSKSGNLYFYDEKTLEKRSCCFVLSEDAKQHIKNIKEAKE